MSNWSRRYASSVCVDCGLQDSGGYQDVRGGKCVDPEVCASRQAYNKANPPVKKPRKKPIVDRKGEAACSHPDCLAEGKRFPLNQLSFEYSYEGKAACPEHWHMIHKGVSYGAWKNEFRRR
jgi:hypothetical protein